MSSLLGKDIPAPKEKEVAGYKVKRATSEKCEILGIRNDVKEIVRAFGREAMVIYGFT